jgi:hypothetical protein
VVDLVNRRAVHNPQVGQISGYRGVTDRVFCSGSMPVADDVGVVVVDTLARPDFRRHRSRAICQTIRIRLSP